MAIKLTNVSKQDVMLELVDEIIHATNRHEVQIWLDHPGTPEDRLLIALRAARDLRGLLTGKLRPEDV